MANHSVIERARQHCMCCRVTRMMESGCRLKGLKPPAVCHVMDADEKYRKNHGHEGKLCDYLAFGCTEETEFVAFVELKSGHLDVDDVAAQLQQGADVVQAILGDVAPGRVVPLLVHGQGLDPFRVAKLAKCHVRFRGSPHRIARVHCGESLADALRKTGA